ncbi:MAG: hypothetical protein KBE16_00530 [Alphaproteobacteria bacterium]|nr:hypothetical protein [Alphaproteobacteria bacterium]
MTEEKSKRSQEQIDEILRVARDRFVLSDEAFKDIRTTALEDLKFRAGDQWPEEIKSERNQDGRPCLTINRIPQFIRQITNDQRQNRPAIRVSPVDDKADIDTAKILQGIIRHIEYNSSADTAYDTAFEGAVTQGFGYFRILTDYVDAKSFDQEILIKKISNSFSVYPDPFSKESDGSDMNWCLIVDNISKDDYEAQYGESELSKTQDWQGIGDSSEGWISEESCRVAEYFYIEYKEETIVLLSNGEVIEKSKVKILPDGITIKDERKTSVPVVKWLKINGIEILEETEWAGQWIPIIPVYGDELNVDGKKILEGVIRHAKDSQRMYNFWASSETEAIALAPKAPYLVAEGQIKGFEGQWALANRKTQAYLPYNPISSGGTVIGAPQRNAYEPPVQAISNARMLASEDLKATTGIYDAALGNRSNENSGIAIQRRNAQTQTSNFHFVDNLSRSLKHAGRILIDLIPKIYDAPRAARILGEDGEQEVVRINEEFQKDGQLITYDLGRGKYDVAVDVGPSFATKRQEAVSSMLEMSKANPQVMAVAGDLLVKNMDWQGAQEIAERLKKTIDPNIIGDDKNKQQVPPEMQAQMQQMNSMIDQLTQKLNEANEQIKTKSIEIESKERIAFAQMEVDLKKELFKSQAEASTLILEQEIAQINQRLGLLDINEDFDSQYENENEQMPDQQGLEMNQQQMPTDGLSSGQPTGV